jgi:hypothetical protein
MVAGRRPSAGLDKGYFYEPTLIRDLTNGSDLCQNEVLGRSPRWALMTPCTRPWPQPTTPGTACWDQCSRPTGTSPARRGKGELRHGGHQPRRP